MSNEKPKVFISHSWENKAKARQLEDELKAANIEVWVDHSDVRGGDVITQKINEAIDWCNIVLLVWTRSASESLWVEREWSAAMQLDKTIITCLFDKTKIPNLLTGLARLDFRNFDEGLNSLFIALRSDRRIKKPPSSPFNKKLVWGGIIIFLTFISIYLIKTSFDESNSPRVVIDSVVMGNGVSDTTEVNFSVVNRAGHKITITELNAKTLGICESCPGKPRGLRYDLGAHFIYSGKVRMSNNDVIFKIDSEDSKSYSCRLYGSWLNESYLLNCLLGYKAAIEIRYIDNATGESGIIESDKFIVGDGSNNCEET